ncbi:hypothetical protein BGZ60DRAFT_171003 [Tricladium varicosporioides]|nr:hypothetical protein BGZ60DRAFT_171003 [Hymenoscyphus varicosporioides]
MLPPNAIELVKKKLKGFLNRKKDKKEEKPAEAAPTEAAPAEAAPAAATTTTETPTAAAPAPAPAAAPATTAEPAEPAVAPTEPAVKPAEPVVESKKEEEVAPAAKPTEPVAEPVTATPVAEATKPAEEPVKTEAGKLYTILLHFYMRFIYPSCGGVYNLHHDFYAASPDLLSRFYRIRLLNSTCLTLLSTSCSSGPSCYRGRSRSQEGGASEGYLIHFSIIDMNSISEYLFGNAVLRQQFN